MVNISTASYKTNEFKLVTIGKGGAGKKIRVNNGAIVLDYNGRGNDVEQLKNPGEGRAVRNRLPVTIDGNVHKKLKVVFALARITR